MTSLANQNGIEELSNEIANIVDAIIAIKADEAASLCAAHFDNAAKRALAIIRSRTPENKY